MIHCETHVFAANLKVSQQAYQTSRIYLFHC